MENTSFPISLIVPFLINAFNRLRNNSDQITIISIILLIIGIIIEVLICIGLSKARKINTKNSDFYFEEYNKHLTVYKNGNGIIINSFKIVFNNTDNIIPFKRELNIEDSQPDTNFPKLKDMEETSLQDRFTQFGFWYKCYNNNKLILSVTEKYRNENGGFNDTISKNNPKILKWIFSFNPSSIEVGKPYKIVYVISVPGMFPIENGTFKEQLANIQNTRGKFSSRFNVKHKIKKFLYTVSFEHGVNLYTNPKGTLSTTSNDSKTLHFNNDNNIIYEKYIFSVDDPELSSTININWCFSFKHTNKKNGGY